MATPPPENKIPGWVTEFVGSQLFTHAVDNRVDLLRTSVDSHFAGLRTTVQELQKARTESEEAIQRAWMAQTPISGLKSELAGLNLAVNGLKAEFNVFDPVKIFGIQDRYDAMLQNLFRSDGRKKELKEQEPENLLKEIRAVKGAVARLKQDLTTVESGIRRTQQTGNQQLRREISDFRAKVENIRQKLLGDNQQLHRRITTLDTRVGRVSQVAHSADDRSRAVRTRTDEALGKVRALDREIDRGRKQVGRLDKEVGTGMQRVGALERGATSASRSIESLRNQMNGLEQALRR
ncbi:chromosome segregation ATPase [Streptomyces sp. V3I8]|uniref:hypothetical protein n=1 Tax=Streptomyces sp. V3I8 TaxID=3042279 RepID=UPI00277D397B|nr:hypothetical protein [Streptomyces sp. V3I8]MDQ1038758.1 chromosome segregation ATPase [Streptomyces sp. V3I8]